MATNNKNFVIKNGLEVTNGKIGVGTDNPQGSLHIKRQDTPNNNGNEIHTDFILENPGAGNARFFLKTNTNNRNWEFFADDNDGAFGIYDGIASARRFTILPSGNIGIDTNNPSDKLHVVGDIRVEDSDPTIKLIDSDGTLQSSQIHQQQANLYFDLRNNTADGNLIVRGMGGGSATEKLRLNSNGQAGIGTDLTGEATDSKLSVEGVTTLANLDQTLMVRDSNNDDAVGRGGSIGFGAYVDGSMRTLAAIGGAKEDTGSNFNGNLVLYTRTNGQADLGESLRIDSSGRLLKSGQAALTSTSLPHPVQIAADASAQNIVCFGRAADDISAIDFYEADKTTNLGEIQYRPDHVNFRHRVGYISFATGGVSERLRIDSEGGATFSRQITSNRFTETTSLSVNIDSIDYAFASYDGSTIKAGIRTNGDATFAGNSLFGTTSNGTTVKGIVARSTGELLCSRNNGPALLVNRLGNDGTLVDFRGQNSSEGNITVSGGSVTLVGAHLSRWSQLPGNAERIEILRGSVLSNVDEMCEWGDEDNEQLNRMKVSDVEGDVNVAGVFQNWDDDDETYTNDFYCSMTGDFVIRIAQGTTVERGDLLMSAGDGTAKPQDDDIIRSKTIAKVTSSNVSETYADGSYCVPCVLMAC